MRLAMVIGEQRLALEQRMLNRLAVGLMAEGVQLVRIVPEGLPASMFGEGERQMALVQCIEAHLRAFPWTRGMHVRRTVEALGDTLPDALYLLGRDGWAFGLQLAAQLDRPAILEAWSATQALALPRTSTHPHLAMVTAPCPGIASVLRSRISSDLIAQVPLGVSATRRHRRVLADPDQPPAIAVLGGARNVTAYAAMLEGLAGVIRDFPSVQVFLELRGLHEHDIWRLAERAGVLGAVSAISSAAQHRALLMRCDLALWPERYGELRSILLETMAMAVPVIAASDHALDMLMHGETARLVSHEAAAEWSQAIGEMLQDPAQAQAIGVRGREYVLKHHRSAEQVARLLDVLQGVAGKDSFAFPQASR